MYFYHAVLLLLSCACVRGTEDRKQDVILDQIALASKSEVEKIPHLVTEKVISKNLSSDETVHSAERMTLRYENSNGFVPKTVPEHQRVKTNLMASDKHSKETDRKKSESVLENDPVYSTEARISFNLPQSGANRRSIDSGDRRSDFEILKVDNDTPEVANYQEFFDNVQSVMNQSRDPADTDKKKSQRNRNRDRSIKTQNNMDTYNTESTRDIGDTYNLHYPVNSYKSNQFKSNYDPEKVNSNYHEQDMSGYNLQRNVTSKEKLVPRTNYNVRQSPGPEKKSPKSEGVHKSNPVYNKNNQIRNKSPVMDVEPSDYKVNMKFGIQSSRPINSPSVPQDNLGNPPDSSNSPSSNIYVQDSSFDNQGTSRHYEQSEDSQGYSDETLDYADVTEKPRRLHKSRRRPQNSELSRKLPKEHRASGYSGDTGDRKRQNLSRAKQRHRQRNKFNNWDEEGRYQFQDESTEDKPLEGSDPEVDNTNSQNVNTQSSDTWNQIGPNVEVSHSNGYEVDQIEKPKLLFPVNVNLVPLSQFDHQTALGSSQGFDITNAMIQNFGGGMSIISTTAPFVSTSAHNLGTKNGQIIQNSRQVPDVIVGQSTLQNPVSIFLPQGQKFQNGRTQYIQSTVTPLFSVTQNINPTSRTASSTATPRPLYASASTVTPTYQQVTLSHLPTNQILVPQPTLQTLSNMVQGNANSNIQVQPHGIQGQNVVHFQNVPSPSTTSNPVTQKPSGGDGHYLATASLSVGNEGQKSSNNRQKTFFQTQMVPAMLQTGVSLGTFNLNNQNQQNSQNSFMFTRARDNDQIQKAVNDGFMNSMKDLQLQIQRNQLSNLGYQGVDNIGSTSNSNVNSVNAIAGIPINIIRAQLPVVGTKNVEIVNPNIKPTPIDVAIFNPVTPFNQYTAMYTTPVPILSTTSFVTSRPAPSTVTAESVHLNNYVDSLTEFGTKSPPTNMYNPINFVPNEELMKSQSVLNSRLPQNEILHQNLNLVPILPGGNFFKNSHGAQANLANKPKLNSDLAKYAEEMLKESLRTMYSSHKWNNDRRVPGNISIADSSELAKLRNELLRYKSATFDSKMPKDILEAHQTENKVRTLSPRPSDSNSKKPPFSMEQIEQILKDDLNLHSSDYLGKPDFEGGSSFKINDYLTPPRLNSFLSKSPFHDQLVKKRPGSGPPGFSRSRPRKGAFGSKPHGLEASASNNFEFGFDTSRFRNRPHFDRDVSDFRPGHHGSHSKFRQKSPVFDNYPTFTTSSLDNDQRTSSKELYDVNHPRFHNLLGLLMKNKRLPNGSFQPYSNNRDRDNFGHFLENEKRRLGHQFYNEPFQSIQKKSDRFRSVHQQNTRRKNPKVSL